MEKDIKKIFDFLKLMKNIKTNLRFNDTAKMPKESIADHSWRLALMVILFSNELNLKINQLKAIKIALVHDIAESITGDIDLTTIMKGKITKAQKNQKEIQAIKKIKSMLPTNVGAEIYSLWHEYNQATTQEAKFIKALDKIETLTTIYEAGHKCYNEPGQIPDYATRPVNNYPPLKSVYNEIMHRLKAELKKMGYVK